MNILISVDMEGITGVTCWDDVDDNKPSYERFRRVMTAEVNAAVEGALLAGAGQVLVNDSHGGMRNVLIEELHPRAELISGYPKPLGMMSGVDCGIDRAFLVGVHARAGTANAILDHTWSSRRVHACFLNGIELGEIGINAALAGAFGVPVALVVGDQAATLEAEALLGPSLKTLAVKQAVSRQAARNRPLSEVQQAIRELAQLACQDTCPEPFVIEGPVTVSIEFADSLQAAGAAEMPGARRISGRQVEWTGEDTPTAFRGMLAMLALA